MGSTPEPGGTPVVTRLFVYPVKGFAGHEVEELALDAVGPVGDRRWMVVKPGDFLTQRTHPRMALLGATPSDDGGLVLRADGREPLAVAEPPPDARRVTVPIWKDRVEAAPADDEAHRWLSDVLREPVRLVRLPDEVPRPVDRNRAVAGFPGRVAFADGFPLLLVGEASVADVDRRVPAGGPSIGVERFRPNVVVGSAPAWAEDRWRRVRIGDLEMAVVKPCARCAVTTVDPRTGERGDEPLTTLASFRRRDGKVWVGQNVLHRRAGAVRVGDRVAVLESGAPRPGGGLAETTDPVD